MHSTSLTAAAFAALKYTASAVPTTYTLTVPDDVMLNNTDTVISLTPPQLEQASEFVHLQVFADDTLAVVNHAVAPVSDLSTGCALCIGYCSFGKPVGASATCLIACTASGGCP